MRKTSEKIDAFNKTCKAFGPSAICGPDLIFKMTLLPIILPSGYIPKISAGDKVSAGDILAEKPGSSSEEIINIPMQIGISPSNVNKSLKKHLGENISEGEVLAVKKVRLGLSSKKFISKFSGTIVKINENTGEVHIRTLNNSVSESLIAPVDGVVDICDNDKIVIKADKEVLVARESVGGENTGESLFINDFNPDKITTKVENKIIIAESIDNVSIFKAIGLYAAGIILENLDNIKMDDLSGKNIKIPVMQLSPEDFKKILKIKGKKFYLNGKNKSVIIL